MSKELPETLEETWREALQEWMRPVPSATGLKAVRVAYYGGALDAIRILKGAKWSEKEGSALLNKIHDEGLAFFASLVKGTNT